MTDPYPDEAGIEAPQLRRWSGSIVRSCPNELTRSLGAGFLLVGRGRAERASLPPSARPSSRERVSAVRSNSECPGGTASRSSIRPLIRVIRRGQPRSGADEPGIIIL